MDDLAQLHAKLDFLCTKIEKIDALETKIDSLESTIQKLVSENDDLRKQVESRDEVIMQLTEKTNRLGQASRSTSLRILGLPITAATTPAKVPSIIHREILTPIFEAAKANGDAPPDPPHIRLLCHRQLLRHPFQEECLVQSCHRQASLRVPTQPRLQIQEIQPPYDNRPLLQLRSPSLLHFQDLSPANFAHFRAIADEYRVKSAWTYNGQTRFKLHESETVHKATTLASTVDSILKKD
jgi:hypothetical protein